MVRVTKKPLVGRGLICYNEENQLSSTSSPAQAGANQERLIFIVLWNDLINYYNQYLLNITVIQCMYTFITV